MRSTLYLKFIIMYIIFGFLSLFTVATLTAGLTNGPLKENVSSSMYREASLVAADYLPKYFSGQITASDVHLQQTGSPSRPPYLRVSRNPGCLWHTGWRPP